MTSTQLPIDRHHNLSLVKIPFLFVCSYLLKEWSVFVLLFRSYFPKVFFRQSPSELGPSTVSIGFVCS